MFLHVTKAKYIKDYEVEIFFKDLASVMNMAIDFLPASIEIIEPQNLTNFSGDMRLNAANTSTLLYHIFDQLADQNLLILSGLRKHLKSIVDIFFPLNKTARLSGFNLYPLQSGQVD